MASVSFDAVHLFNPSTGESLIVDTVSKRDPAPQTPGEERMYGNGRYVGLSAGATSQQYQVTFQAVDAATVATLRAWDSVLLCYLDDLGNKCWGRYRSPQISGRTVDSRADVSITFVGLTYSDLL